MFSIIQRENKVDIYVRTIFPQERSTTQVRINLRADYCAKPEVTEVLRTVPSLRSLESQVPYKPEVFWVLGTFGLIPDSLHMRTCMHNSEMRRIALIRIQAILLYKPPSITSRKAVTG
jgi:hypothetical protein